MIRPLLFLASSISLVAQELPNGTLSFLDKNVISGEILEITPDGIIKLQSPFLNEVSDFKTEDLLTLSITNSELPKNTKPQVHATSTSHYQDPHRDTIKGALLALDENQIVLETSYAGNLKLNRKMIQGINIFATSAGFYLGPDALDQWTFASGNEKDKGWSEKDGAFIARSNAPIAREIKTGKRTHFSLDIDWKGGGDYTFQLLADDGKNHRPNNRLEFAINNASYVRLVKYSRDANGTRSNTLFQTSFNQLRRQTSATFDFYIDRTGEKPSAILIDGEQVGTWNEEKLDENLGDWLRFIPTTNTPLRISRIEVRDWDGRLPESNATDQEESPQPDEIPENELENQTDGQQIELANGDTLVGTVSSVEGDHLKVDTQIGQIALPIDRARQIGMADADTEEVKMNNGDVRAWFHDGGYLTFRLESFKDGKLKGYSQIYGDAEFNLKAFSRIDFNIWSKAFNQKRAGSSDW